MEYDILIQDVATYVLTNIRSYFKQINHFFDVIVERWSCLICVCCVEDCFMILWEMGMEKKNLENGKSFKFSTRKNGKPQNDAHSAAPRS